MDTNAVDGRFAQLQQQAEGTASLIQALATKLSAAAATDGSAREWALDLREIALAVRDEQTTTTELLQSIHALVDEHVQQTPAMPAYPPPVTYAQPQRYQPQYAPQPAQYQPAQGGGTLQHFLGGRFGQAIVSGAGIGIGDDLVNSIFDRL